MDQIIGEILLFVFLLIVVGSTITLEGTLRIGKKGDDESDGDQEDEKAP